MKYSILKSLRIITTIALLFVLCPQLFAAPPPPPGVPIDGGISFLIIAAVGYGASKMTKDSENVI
jgi:hypothetical protein